MLKNENNSILFFKHLLKVALSQFFFILVQIQKKMVANHGPENYFFRWIVFSDFAPFLGDLGHSENLFEIIPPLSRNDSNINNDVVHLSLHYLVHTKEILLQEVQRQLLCYESQTRACFKVRHQLVYMDKYFVYCLFFRLCKCFKLGLLPLLS